MKLLGVNMDQQLLAFRMEFRKEISIQCIWDENQHWLKRKLAADKTSAAVAPVTVLYDYQLVIVRVSHVNCIETDQSPEQPKCKNLTQNQFELIYQCHTDRWQPTFVMIYHVGDDWISAPIKSQKNLFDNQIINRDSKGTRNECRHLFYSIHSAYDSFDTKWILKWWSVRLKAKTPQ